MSVEQILNNVEEIELSGHLMEGTLRDYCAAYGVPMESFDGAMKSVAMKAVADVALATMLASLVEESVDFDELLVRMGFGEGEPAIALMQQRLLDDHRDPFVLTVTRRVYDQRLKKMESWIRRAAGKA